MYEVKREESRTFDFKIGKTKYSVPLSQYLPWSIVKGYQATVGNASGADRGMAAMGYMVSIFNQYTDNALDQLTTGEISDLFTAYEAESKVSMGESAESQG